MAQCIDCGAETQLYVADVPICPSCEDKREEERREKAKKAPSREELPKSAGERFGGPTPSY